MPLGRLIIVGADRRDKLIRYDNRSDTKEDALGEAVDVEEMVLILIVIMTRIIVSIVIMIQCSNDDDDDDDNDGKAGHNIFGDIQHCHHYHHGNASLT